MGRWCANQSQFSLRQSGKHPLLSNLMMSYISWEQFLPQPRTWGHQGQPQQLGCPNPILPQSTALEATSFQTPSQAFTCIFLYF